MGKYSSNNTPQIKDFLLCAIANELAELVLAQQITANNTNDMARQAKEANRLKRLELGQNMGDWVNQDGLKVWKTPVELEDQA